MATVTRYASAYESTGAGWTSPGNAYSDDGNYVSVASPGKKVGSSNTYTTFGFDANIPSGSTINAVTIEIGYYVSGTTSIAECHTAAIISGVEQTEHTDNSEPTGPPETLKQFVCTGDRSWSRTDLLDANFKVRVECYQGNVATSFTMYIDYVRVLVDYTGVVSNVLTSRYNVRNLVSKTPVFKYGIEGWLTGYSKRAKITIGASGTNLTNYQVCLTVYSGSGTNSAGVIYLNGNALDWPEDIRFADKYASSFDFWREEYDANSGLWWIEVPSITTTSGAEFYIYYGKSSDTDASDGNNTFILFDHFDDNSLDTGKWQTTYMGGGSYSESGTNLNIAYTGTGNNPYMASLAAYATQNRAFHARVRLNSGLYNSTDLTGFHVKQTISTDNGIYLSYLLMEHYANCNDYYLETNGATYETWGNWVDWALSTWYKIGHKFGTSRTTWFQGTNENVYSGANPSLNINGYIMMGFYTVASAPTRVFDMDFDYVFIRNYYYTEPAFGTPGSEEGSGGNYVISRIQPHLYNIRTSVLNVFVSRYSILTGIERVKAFLYNLSKPSASLVAIYSKRKTIRATKLLTELNYLSFPFYFTKSTDYPYLANFLYNIEQGKPTAALTQIYNLFNKVTEENAFLYDIRSEIFFENRAIYNIRNSVSGIVRALYNVRSIVAAITIGVYHIGGTLSKILSSVYDIRNSQMASLTGVYNVRSIISSSKTAIYDIRNAIQKALVTIYDIKNVVQKALGSIYNILSVAAVNSVLISLYHINTSVSSVANFSYEIRNIVNSAVKSLYGIRISVQGALKSVYDLRNYVTASEYYFYSIYNRAIKTVSTLYNIVTTSVVSHVLWLRYKLNPIESPVVKNPTAEGTNSWTNPSYGRTSNNAPYATASPAKNGNTSGIWTTFGITDPGGGATITKVELGIEFYVSTTTSIATINTDITWNGGTNWGTHLWTEASTEANTTDPNAYTWVDVTGDTSWTWDKLSDANLQLRIVARHGNSSTGILFNLDALAVRVTFSTLISRSIGYLYNIVSTYSVTRIFSSLYNILGSVSYSESFHYDIRTLVSGTKSALYNILNGIEKVAAFLYHIKNSVVTTATAVYRIHNIVQSISKSVYNIRELIVSSTKLIYNINSSLQKVFAAIYNIRNYVVKTNGLLYHIRGIIQHPLKYVYSIFNRISAPVTFRYDIRNILSKTQKSIYRIFNFVVSSTKSLYHIRGLVTSSKKFVYNIGGALMASLQAIYNILSKTTSSRGFKYNILQSVTASGEFVYAIINKVQSVGMFVYNILGRPAAYLKSVYHIWNKVSKGAGYIYNIRNRISNISIYKYNILESVTKNVKSIYNILSFVAVSASQIMKYNIRNGISSTQKFLYNISTAPLATLRALYNVRNRLTGKPLASLYNMRSLVTAPKKFIYDLRNSVSKATHSLYNIRNIVLASRSFFYNIGGRLTKVLSSIYNIRGTVFSPLKAIYSMRTSISNSFVSLYRIRTLVSNARKFVYSIIGRPAAYLSGMYNIRNVVSRAKSAIYNINTSVSGVSKYVYNIRTLVSSSRKSLYNILALVSESVEGLYRIRGSVAAVGKYLYNIRSFVSKQTVFVYPIRQTVSVAKNFAYGIVSIFRVENAKGFVYRIFGIEGLLKDPYNRLMNELYDYFIGRTTAGLPLDNFYIYKRMPRNRPLFFPCVTMDMERGTSDAFFGKEYSETVAVKFQLFFKRDYSRTVALGSRQVILMKEALARYYRNVLLEEVNGFQTSTVKLMDVNVTGMTFAPVKRGQTLYGATVTMQFRFKSGDDWEEE